MGLLQAARGPSDLGPTTRVRTRGADIVPVRPQTECRWTCPRWHRAQGRSRSGAGTIQRVKGLILSGGRGTRLRPITHTSAKQLVPVANKPILFYALEAVVAAGITDIGIVTGDTGAEVRAAVGDGSRFGAQVTYIAQDSPRGLAHAVLTARSYLADEPFVMYLGDNLIRKGIVPIVESFTQSQPDALILLARVPEPQHFGVAELHDGKVVRLVEKPANPVSDFALVGVYLFNHTVFDAIDAIEYSSRGELEITDAIQRMIDTGRRVEPHLIVEPHEAMVATWKDTGRLEDMLEANRFVLDDLPPRNDGRIGEGVRLDGKVIVEAGAELRNCTIRGPAIIGERTIIDDAYVGPYTSIYYGCTVRSAELEYSIVLENSIIENVDGKIESSLIGKECLIGRSPLRPRAYKLMVGDHSRVELR
jgi:glucose-1-phosphate thymidylyltransferase